MVKATKTSYSKPKLCKVQVIIDFFNNFRFLVFKLIKMRLIIAKYFLTDFKENEVALKIL